MWEDSLETLTGAQRKDQPQSWSSLRGAILDSSQISRYLVMRPTDVRKAVDGVKIDAGRTVAKAEFLKLFDKEVMPVVEKWKRAKFKKHVKEDDSKIFKSVFDKYDKDKTGDLDVEELANALAGLEKELGSGNGVVDDKKRRSAQRVLDKMDLDGNKTLSYAEFEQMCVTSDGFSKLLARRKQMSSGGPPPPPPPPGAPPSKKESRKLKKEAKKRAKAQRRASRKVSFLRLSIEILSSEDRRMAYARESQEAYKLTHAYIYVPRNPPGRGCGSATAASRPGSTLATNLRRWKAHGAKNLEKGFRGSGNAGRRGQGQRDPQVCWCTATGSRAAKATVCRCVASEATWRSPKRWASPSPTSALCSQDRGAEGG